MEKQRQRRIVQVFAAATIVVVLLIAASAGIIAIRRKMDPDLKSEVKPGSQASTLGISNAGTATNRLEKIAESIKGVYRNRSIAGIQHEHLKEIGATIESNQKALDQLILELNGQNSLLFVAHTFKERLFEFEGKKDEARYELTQALKACVLPNGMLTREASGTYSRLAGLLDSAQDKELQSFYAKRAIDILLSSRRQASPASLKIPNALDFQMESDLENALYMNYWRLASLNFNDRKLNEAERYAILANEAWRELPGAKTPIDPCSRAFILPTIHLREGKTDLAYKDIMDLRNLADKAVISSPTSSGYSSDDTYPLIICINAGDWYCERTNFGLARDTYKQGLKLAEKLRLENAPETRALRSKLESLQKKGA